METRHVPQPSDPRKQLLQLGFDSETVQAIELRCAIWALANDFSGGQCEITHSEAVSSDDKIHQVVLCLSFGAHSYDDFASYLEKRASDLPSTETVSVAIGFNYDNPGLIEINESVVTYSVDKDIMDIPDAEKLTYGRGKAREVIEQLGDLIWDRIRN